MEITRRANKDDVDTLVPLFEDYRAFYKMQPNAVGAKQFLYERISRGESVIYICERNDIILGFVQLYPIFSSTRMKRLWVLNDLFVHPQYRGKGVSIYLIHAAKQLCIETNACGMILETEKTNDIGNQLYPRVGFQIDERFNHYLWAVPD